MPFVDEITNYESVAIVGLEKNTGKTECLNYILNRLRTAPHTIALTSIGIDGESEDQVTGTHKPEIEIVENTLFVTSEKHYRQKQLISEVLNVGTHRTSLGRLVTARALSCGKVLLSGPSGTAELKKLIVELRTTGAQTVLVDGALSRLSLSSPAITQAMVLATGAALSSDLKQLVRKTRYVYDLIELKEIEGVDRDVFMNIEKGIWAIDRDKQFHDLKISSAFLLEKHKEKVFKFGQTLFVAGAVTDSLLNFLRVQKNVSEIVLVMKDFTRMFASLEAFNAFLKRGGQIKVIQKTKLLAVCVNPVAPNGFRFDSGELCRVMQQSLGIPVYDIRQMIV